VDVKEDVLGPEYEAIVLPLGEDFEGEVIATLVRRRAAAPTRRAVLYVHGFVDYFFQRHLADFYVERGFDFYALDLRKYGRSLLPHQTPNFIHSLSEYFTEIDEAVRIIREADGHDVLLINAHSTGGLTTSLWADRVKGKGLVQGLFLNSPFFDMNIPAPVRIAGDVLSKALRARWPTVKLPSPRAGLYVRHLHRDYEGEWDFDLNWKPMFGFPVRAAWLAAIRRAHARLHAGLEIDAPVLVMASTRSARGRAAEQAVSVADIVLDVDHIARWAPKLGPRVTVVRIKDGIHDLVLSGKEAREQVFTELDRWIRSYLPEPPSA